jgi:hypothetical protein
MKWKCVLLLALYCALAVDYASAQTPSARCSRWAREQTRVTRTTPPPGRSTARNAAGGGTARTRLGQRHRSYQFFYDQCMSRR